MQRKKLGELRKKQFYQISAQWRVTQEDNILRLYGGADAEYEVELASADDSIFASKQSEFSRSDLSSNDARVFEQLLTAGVVVLAGKDTPLLRVAIVGDKPPIKMKSGARVSFTNDVENADLVIVLRSRSTHKMLVTKYYDLEKPYIYADLAYHHTVSIGPLVYAGETACIGCLYGRIYHRWGDEMPPARPAIQEYDELIRALLTSEIYKFAKGDRSLVGKVVAWDVAGRTTTVDTLLKSSTCPQCGGPILNKTVLLK